MPNSRKRDNRQNYVNKLLHPFPEVKYAKRGKFSTVINNVRIFSDLNSFVNNRATIESVNSMYVLTGWAVK